MIANPVRSNEKEALRAYNCGRSGYRKPYCGLYSACLDYAMGLKWKGFRCDSCRVETQIGTEQAQFDHLGLMRVAAAILATGGDHAPEEHLDELQEDSDI